jgi:hypothetical protein
VTWLTLSLVGIAASLGFIFGALFAGRTAMWWRINMFRDVDHLIGMILEVTSVTNDRRIAPGVVLDQLEQIKYGLNLPVHIEKAEDQHPTY